MLFKKAIPRRTFLARAAALGAAGGACLVNPLGILAADKTRQSRLETLTVADFTPHVGTTFRVRLAPTQTVDLTLTEAQALRVPRTGARNAPQRKPFHLLFQGPDQPRLPQFSYEVEHAQLGRLTFLIVAVDKPELRHYQAVFA